MELLTEAGTSPNCFGVGKFCNTRECSEAINDREYWRSLSGLIQPIIKGFFSWRFELATLSMEHLDLLRKIFASVNDEHSTVSSLDSHNYRSMFTRFTVIALAYTNETASGNATARLFHHFARPLKAHTPSLLSTQSPPNPFNGEYFKNRLLQRKLRTAFFQRSPESSRSPKKG